MAAIAVSREPGRDLWLRSPAWDLTFVSLSAALVVVPYALFLGLERMGLNASDSASVVDLVVTLLVGGPHMYATFTRTVADPVFRRDHRRIVTTSLLIPVGVVLLGFWSFPILLTLFFFWASIHVLHQITYLVECYNRRDPRPLTWWDRGIDYAVVMISPYPLALQRLVDGTFEISGQTILLPTFLAQRWLVWLSLAGFAAALMLFLAKTLLEFRHGSVHWPKLLLISLTVLVAFLLPTFDRLDAAFQGFNAWHSFQYLGLTWYANNLAARHGGASPPPAVLRGWRFYGAMVLCTIGAGVIVLALTLLREPLGLSPEQPYYITVLSFLLIHYYHDHVLFTRPEAIVGDRVRGAVVAV
jgi:hypothetical protein